MQNDARKTGVPEERRVCPDQTIAVEKKSQRSADTTSFPAGLISSRPLKHFFEYTARCQRGTKSD
jgi:hypothetical protein